MAQKFQKITVKPKAVIIRNGDWVDVPDPFGKHKTRKAIVVGFSGNMISVKPCYTHFDDAVIRKHRKSVISPNGVECKMLEEIHHIPRELVKPAVFY